MDDRLTVDSQMDATRGICTMKPSGSLLVSNIQPFKNRLRDVEARGLIIDLSDVDHVDSVGIGVLVNVLMSRKKHGGSLVLAGVTERVMSVLKGTQVDQLFRFADSTANAAAMMTHAAS